MGISVTAVETSASFPSTAILSSRKSAILDQLVLANARPNDVEDV